MAIKAGDKTVKSANKVKLGEASPVFHPAK